MILKVAEIIGHPVVVLMGCRDSFVGAQCSSTEFLHYFYLARAYFLKEWYGSHIYIELKSFFLEIMVPVTSEALDDTRNTSTELPLRRCPGILHSFGHRVTSNEKYLLGNYNWPITSLTMSHHFLNNFRVIITGPSLP